MKWNVTVTSHLSPQPVSKPTEAKMSQDLKDSLPTSVKRKRRQREGWERGREEKGVPRESGGAQAVLAGPWLRARPQLFMRQCTCQEPTDKHNGKAERKSNSASMGDAHNAPGGTHLGPSLCCFQINREQGYLSTAWFSSRARSCWNHLCLSSPPPLYLSVPFPVEILAPVDSIFSRLITSPFHSL